MDGISGFEAGIVGRHLRGLRPSRLFQLLSKLNTVSKESHLHPFKLVQQIVRVGRVKP